MARSAQATARADEIERIDALSRTRALSDEESRRLQDLLYRDRYARHAAERRRCPHCGEGHAA